MQKKHKIIVDTNLWVSFLLTRQFDFLDALLDDNKAVLVFSQELLEEFVDVTQRPKLKPFFRLEDLERLLRIVDEKAMYYVVNSRVDACRDDKDNFLLSLAKDSKADYLITGDKDLLVLEEFERTKIITIKEYESLCSASFATSS